MWQQERFIKRSRNSVRNMYNSFTIFMQMLNVDCVCQVRVIRKNFNFSQTWKYNTKFHDPWTPLFWADVTFELYEDTMVFGKFIFIFCLEPTIRKDTWMNTTSVTVVAFFQKCHSSSYLITAMFKVPSQ